MVAAGGLDMAAVMDVIARALAAQRIVVTRARELGLGTGLRLRSGAPVWE